MLVVALVGAALLFARWLAYRLSHSITGDAFVESDMINLAPQVPGEIVAMLVQDNERVQRGQLLCRIDPTIFARDVETAKANLDVAEADLAVAVTALSSLARRVPEQIARAEKEQAIAQNERSGSAQALARIRETVAHEIARAEHDLSAGQGEPRLRRHHPQGFAAAFGGLALGPTIAFMMRDQSPHEELRVRASKFFLRFSGGSLGILLAGVIFATGLNVAHESLRLGMIPGLDPTHRIHHAIASQAIQRGSSHPDAHAQAAAVLDAWIQQNARVMGYQTTLRWVAVFSGTALAVSLLLPIVGRAAEG